MDENIIKMIMGAALMVVNSATTLYAAAASNLDGNDDTEKADCFKARIHTGLTFLIVGMFFFPFVMRYFMSVGHILNDLWVSFVIGLVCSGLLFVHRKYRFAKLATLVPHKLFLERVFICVLNLLAAAVLIGMVMKNIHL